MDKTALTSQLMLLQKCSIDMTLPCWCLFDPAVSVAENPFQPGRNFPKLGRLCTMVHLFRQCFKINWVLRFHARIKVHLACKGNLTLFTLSVGTRVRGKLTRCGQLQTYKDTEHIPNDCSQNEFIPQMINVLPTLHTSITPVTVPRILGFTVITVPRAPQSSRQQS